MEKLTLEECKALYFDEDALVTPNYQLYRLNNHQGGRFYYREIDGEIKFYMSVTNMISSTTPTGQGLIDWMISMGKEESQAYARERALYGTFMHTQFTNLLINRKIDLSAMIEELSVYMQDENVNMSLFESWSNEIKKDFLSFVSFVHTHKVKPLAIEVVLCDDEYDTAGAIDLYCEMQVLQEGYHGETYKSNSKYGKIGDPKLSKDWVTIRAVVDYKSGKKGFYEEHEIQLAAYTKMIKETFGVHVDAMYNFSPTDWKTEPTFHLKDQTNSVNIQKLPFLAAIGKIEMSKRMNRILTIGEGIIDLDAITDENGIEQFYDKIELSQFIKNKNEKANRAD